MSNLPDFDSTLRIYTEQVSQVQAYKETIKKNEDILKVSETALNQLRQKSAQANAKINALYESIAESDKKIEKLNQTQELLQKRRAALKAKQQGEKLIGQNLDFVQV